MVKNIIIVDKNIQNIKKIINTIVNKIEIQNIKTFVATDRYEIQEINRLNDISLILINKNLNYIHHFENNFSVFYYRR
ncbi:MAG: hypothetical protein ACI4XD_03470 [Clostridia bacterium]